MKIGNNTAHRVEQHHRLAIGLLDHESDPRLIGDQGIIAVMLDITILLLGKREYPVAMHLANRNQDPEAEALFDAPAVSGNQEGVISYPITHIQGVKGGRTHPPVAAEKTTTQPIPKIKR